MSDLRLTHKEAQASKNQVLLSLKNGFLYPVYSLEPDQFYFTGFIFQGNHQTPAPLFTQYIYCGDLARHLCIFIGSGKTGDLIQFCFI